MYIKFVFVCVHYTYIINPTNCFYPDPDFSNVYYGLVVYMETVVFSFKTAFTKTFYVMTRKYISFSIVDVVVVHKVNSIVRSVSC